MACCTAMHRIRGTLYTETDSFVCCTVQSRAAPYEAIARSAPSCLLAMRRPRTAPHGRAFRIAMWTLVSIAWSIGGKARRSAANTMHIPPRWQPRWRCTRSACKGVELLQASGVVWPYTQVTPDVSLHDLMRAHNFAMLVSQPDGASFASHLPLTLETTAGP